MTHVKANFDTPKPTTVIARLLERNSPNDSIFVSKSIKKEVHSTGFLSINLDQTTENQAWELTLLPRNDSNPPRVVKIGSEAKVDWEDLIDVNPSTFTPSGSGGGDGDVTSVNGKTGEVVLTLDNLASEGMILANSIFMVANDAEAPTAYTIIQNSTISASDSTTSQGSALAPGGVSVGSAGNRTTIIAPESGGDLTQVILPSASGTLALTSDITAPTLTEVLVQGGEIAYGQGFQFLNESEELKGLLDYDSGFMHINSAGIAASVGGGVVGASNTSTSESVQVSSTEISYGEPGQGYKRLRIGDGDATEKIIELPASSGTLALTSEMPEIPEAPTTGTHVLKSVEGVLTWVEEI